MCMKHLPRDLNPDSYSPHPTNIYTCGVIIVSKVCEGRLATQLILPKFDPLLIAENKEKCVLE